jgi:hypothetical protein
MQFKRHLDPAINMKTKEIFLATLLFILSTSFNIFGQNSNLVIDDNYTCRMDVDSVNGMPIFTVVEEMPVFPGGEEARLEFIQKNLRLQQNSNMNSATSRIFLTFVIDTSGYVTNPCLLKREFPDKFSDAEKEGLRILSIMPKWIPGKQAGIKVPVRFIMPLRL